MTSSQAAPLLAFPPFVLDRRRAELTCQGASVTLRPKTFALLTYLADHPGCVVDKEELLAAVWPNVVVTDDSLSQCVNELRAALGDAGHRLIRTVPRRGYLFDAEVAVRSPAAELATGSATPRSTPGPAPGQAAASVMREAAAPAAPRRADSRWLSWPLRHWALALAAVAAAIATAALTWLPSDDEFSLDKAVAARRSIAVIPFSTVDEQKRDYFSAAVTEDIAAVLGRLPDTWVIASASAGAAAARETDVRKIGKELGVRYLLTGSVRRNGDAVQVAVQLVASDSGVALWSERYEYAGVSEWAWQRDVGLRIARTLDRRISFPHPPTEASAGRLDVVDAVMQGHYLLRRSSQAAELSRARALFERALAADPNSVSALCGLAIAHMAEVRSLISVDAKAQTQLAFDAASRALALAPGSSRAQYAMGNVLYVRGDVAGAERQYLSVIEANPSDSWAHMRLGMARMALGKFELVPAHMARAQRLNPLEPSLVSTALLGLAISEFHLGNDDAAYEHLRQATSTNPNLANGWAWRSAIDSLHGRTADAADNLQRARLLRPALTIRSLLFVQHASIPERLRPGIDRFRKGLLMAGLAE